MHTKLTTKYCHFCVNNVDELDYKNLQEIVHLLLSPWYDDINNEFINGLINGMKQNLDISRKCKKVGIALQNEIPIGIIIVTPKRGGATKCSPFILNQNNLVCFQKLLEYASKSFIEFLSRKSYIHIPILQSFTIQNAINLGYKPEGILQEPYKPGIELVHSSHFISTSPSKLCYRCVHSFKVYLYQ